jgi:hypothetical protein
VNNGANPKELEVGRTNVTTRFVVWLAVCLAIGGRSGTALALPAGEHDVLEYDVVVYGATAGGVAAAVWTGRAGQRVVLVEPSEHVGGLTSGGLGATDIGNKGAIGGVAREFYRRVGRHYSDPASWVWQTRESYKSARQGANDEEEMWTFEPHVAEQVLREMLDSAGADLVLGERLDLAIGVVKANGRVTTIRMESGMQFRAKMFIDATYEGDMMAKAGISYTVGREANSVYGETYNGVQLGSKKHQFLKDVDPYVRPGDASSGLVPGIQGMDPGRHGEGDRRVQAYNFRLCLTDVPENRLPFPKPEQYDPLRYELLLRYVQAGVWDAMNSNLAMPNRKTDLNNNGGFSTDNIGMNYDYPDGDYAARQAIFDEHKTYQQGLFWFLANDPRVPARVRDDVNRWGLAKDEFTEGGGWPHQLYVREARRMVSAYVMTEHDCTGARRVDDSVGLAAYTMDSHNTQRYAKDGRVTNEGDVQVGGFPPYPISFRSIVPKEEECTNVLVPVCLAASHIAYGSIRMEPVFMVLGQSAATAACQAIEEGVNVQRINVEQLQTRLKADGQVLEWTGPAGARGRDPRTLPGIVVDDRAADVHGGWVSSQSVGGFVGWSYLHDNRSPPGTARVRFPVKVEKSGHYKVRIAFTPHANRAAKVPVAIEHARGVERKTVDQRGGLEADGFLTLGVFPFESGRPAFVEISNEGAAGYVVADAAQLLPVDE